MSTSISMKLTTAGRAALWNAQSTGVNAGLTHIQIGTGHRTPDGSETALLTAQQTTPIAAGSKPSATQIRVAGLFPGVTNYDFSEVGVFIGNPASGGVLFAYYSVPTGKIGTMVAGTDFIFAHEWTMAASDAAAITIVADAGQSSMLSMMAAHEGGADPHPQYATEAYLLTLAGTANPLMNGAVSPGTGYVYSRVNHVHPVDTSRQAALGYTPVQQGTGVGQTGNVNTVKIGWSAGSKLKVTVDNSDLGNFAFEAWVSALFTALRDGVPDVLSTLGKISAALGNDPNFATTITNLIAGKASKTGDTFTGPIAVSHATEAQMVARVAGQNDVILFSNSANWGLYSNSGGTLFSFNRDSGKMFFAGIDSAEIVRNNSGTYSINITGDAGSVGGYAASQLWRADMALSWPRGFKLPNGWIIQMGKSPAQALGARPVTFPVSFPNAVLGISATKSHPSNGSVVPGTALSGNIPTLSGMTLGVNDNAYDVFWIAIGN